MTNNQAYPDFLKDYQSLKLHFDEVYSNCDSNEKGERFANFVRSIAPYTNVGRNFDLPELEQRSHDGGVDLKATNDQNDELLIQSKYTLRDKADFGTIISKFQDYYQKNYTKEPLFAFSGVQVESKSKVAFQIITLHDLTRIKKLFEDSELSSVGFYRQLIENHQLEIIDGNVVLQILRTAYRRTHFLPSNFELQFTTKPIAWDNVFLGIVSGSQLRKLYSEYGDSLFFENLRDFLSSTEVNLDIVKTVKGEPDQLLARNNGIVFKASNVEWDYESNSIKLHSGSVVNGCQTTLSVVQNMEEECFVLVKVVKTTQENT